MNYVIINTQSDIIFGPVAFEKAIFQERLNALGVNISLSNHYYQGLTYSIKGYIDNTPTYSKEYQNLANVQTVREGDNMVRTATISDKYTLEEFKALRIKQIKKEWKRRADVEAELYPSEEVARWPAVQDEIMSYRLNGQTGKNIDRTVSRGKYTADTFADFIEARVSIYNQYRDVKDTHVSEVEAYTTMEEVASHNQFSEWHNVLNPTLLPEI